MTLKNILNQLDIIKIKAGELNDRGFKEAASEALKLYSIIYDAVKGYESQQKTKKEFEAICNDAIAKARPALEKHRGWTELLNTLSSIIVSALTLGITNLITGKHWLFTDKTDSAKKLHKLEQSLKEALLTSDVVTLSQKPTDTSVEVVIPQPTATVTVPMPIITTPLTVSIVTAPLQTAERPLVENEFLKTLKKLLTERGVTYSPSPSIADPTPKTRVLDTVEEPKGLLGTTIDLFDKYRDAKGLLNQASTFIPQVHEIIPLVSKPIDFNLNGVQIFQPKLSEFLSGKPKYALDGLTVFIPGVLGFQYSPFVRPIKTLETLREHSASIGGSALALFDSLSSVDYTMWPKIAFTHHYNWDPRKQRIENLAQSFRIATVRFNGLTVTAMQFFSRTIKVDLPADKLNVTDVTQSEHFKPFVNIIAATANLLNTDYELPLGSAKAANSFKLLRDLHFLGQQNFFGTMHNIHSWMFKITSATTLFQASKDVLELYKYSDVIKKPVKAVHDITQELFKSTGPWPQESYNFRLETYDFFFHSLLGKGDKLSSFESKIQNLLYNLTVSSGGVSALALTRIGSLAYIPYYLISSLFRNSDEYSWYPNVVDSVLGDSLSGLNPSPETMVMTKVLLHFANKLAWDQLIVPLLIQLPIKGFTTAASRELAEKMINNPDFILNLRFQLKELLKNALFNPIELAEFEDFEPPLIAQGTCDVEKQIIKIASTTKTIQNVARLFDSKAPTSSILSPRYAFYNLRDPFINFMSAAPIFMGSNIASETADLDFLLDQATDVIENNLGVPGLTKGKKGKSYIEILAYPLVRFSAWAWNIFGDAPQSMLTSIKNATTLRDLPKHEEVEEIVDIINDSLEESRHTVVFPGDRRNAKQLIKQLRSSYADKIEELSTNIVDAKKETKALFSCSSELKKLISEDNNEEISADIISQISNFKVAVSTLIAKYQKDSEASTFSNLLKAVPDELDSLVKNKNSHNLSHLCFSLFLQYLESRSQEQTDIEGLLKIATSRLRLNPGSSLIPTIIDDLNKLKLSDNGAKNINSFADAMKDITRDIILLSSLFISNPNQATLTLNEFNNLCELYNALEIKYKSINKSLDGIFINGINQSTQIALDSIRDKQQNIKNSLTEIDGELKPLNTLFEQLNSNEHLALPTEEQMSAFKKLTQIPEDFLSQPLLVREYRQKQLAGKDKEQFKDLILLKLDKIIEEKKKTVEELISKKTVTVTSINQQANQFRTDLMSFISYLLPEDAAFRILCEGKINLLDNQFITLHNKYDARNEIATALSGLNKYITKINDIQSLMSSVWVRTAQLLLVHQEMIEVIAKTTELLKPYTTNHNSACKAVLRTMGLTINDERPVETQIEASIAKHLKTHLFKLIKIDINTFVEKTIATMKGSEDLTNIRSQQLKMLNEKFCSVENIQFFNNKEEIEGYILQNIEESMPKLTDAKTTKFIDGLMQKINGLNVQLHLEPPSRYNFFSAVPISRAEYDKQNEAIKNEVAKFDPQEKRDVIMQSISVLFEAPVKTTISAPASQSTITSPQ